MGLTQVIEPEEDLSWLTIMDSRSVHPADLRFLVLMRENLCTTDLERSRSIVRTTGGSSNKRVGATRRAPGNELCAVVAIVQGMDHALQDPERG
jgi:hypothetical protein